MIYTQVWHIIDLKTAIYFKGTPRHSGLKKTCLNSSKSTRTVFAMHLGYPEVRKRRQDGRARSWARKLPKFTIISISRQYTSKATYGVIMHSPGKYSLLLTRLAATVFYLICEPSESHHCLRICGCSATSSVRKCKLSFFFLSFCLSRCGLEALKPLPRGCRDC